MDMYAFPFMRRVQNELISIQIQPRNPRKACNVVSSIKRRKKKYQAIFSDISKHFYHIRCIMRAHTYVKIVVTYALVQQVVVLPMSLLKCSVCRQSLNYGMGGVVYHTQSAPQPIPHHQFFWLH